MTSTVVLENFESRVLGNNPLRDPAVRRIPVYLPPGYENGNQRYPTAYVLSGFTGRGLQLLNDTAWDEPLPQRLDRLIGQGSLRPLIVVMPDCFTRYGGSQYINSSATGRYEDHLIQELVPHIDSKYRTVPEPAWRAVLGKSSGGYGALVLGMRHPEVFGLVADHSGDKYFELCYKLDFPKCLEGLAKFGGLAKFLSEFPHPQPRPHKKLWADTANIVCMAACYSPNPGSLLGFDLPFDEATGELDPHVWARWLEHDPVHIVQRHAEALRSLRLLYLDCGNRDEFCMHYGTRILVRRLQELGIAYFHEEYDDGHFGVQYRYDRSFTMLSEAVPT